ncbi:hypothetical protein SAMN05216464_110101 [Mucilaginibacter pineti]|uniref:Uncharacterized protein n=1 Tax=Mucilaginibacter pineti TaxID=1391627 RepID=A0A1G7GE19_9SPHI|nr:hypothetical protein [Mucilaginibacter pineti]SDE86380.1 hypothetical protein SAMN05216464_110101 [Mucilaginibacter pineti]
MQVISEHSRIHGAAKRTARCSRSPKGTTPKRSSGKPAPDFLRHSFLPLYVEDGEALPDKEPLEQQYFESLALLQSAYPMQLLDVSTKAYPYNLLLSAWDAERKIRRIEPDKDVHLLGCTFLIDSGKRMNTRQRLYYIPIQPLFILTKVKGKQGRKTAQLLLSVFAYLYHHAGIPCYTSPSSFIRWQYEMLEEWLTDEHHNEDEQEDVANQLNEIRAVHHYGEIVRKKLRHESHFSTFNQRMETYRPCNNWEREILKLAQDIYQLWQAYPDTNIYSHIIPMECEDEDEQITRIEQYVSFVATSDGALFDGLFQMVNERLGESVDMDEPAAFTIYGKNQKISVETFDYEQRLLPLLEDLIYLLNNRS